MAATPDPVKVGASERGHDEGKKGAICSKSRDMVTSLKARVSQLKFNLGMLGERIDDIDGLAMVWRPRMRRSTAASKMCLVG
ncbi:hypothetical protein PanWU01x14_242270 [Parasponia andersonii]|uniref:Uncharacterized protein n=1 Tax=Parasponia andersonii TaxID=3476 RepID=A0A2P5BG39_PARAD|nr:hypothetical protein PanWU01x14_242270 [Parasponia andersonii]